MRCLLSIFLILLLSACGGSDSNKSNDEPIAGLPSSEGGDCNVNSGVLSCSGLLTKLDSLDEIDGLTSIQFNNVSLSQQELDSIPVLNDVRSFTLKAAGGSVQSFDMAKLPALEEFTLSDSYTLKRIENLNLVPQLKVLTLSNNRQLTTLDVSTLDQLTHFNVAGSEQLDLNLAEMSAQTTLTALDIANTEISINVPAANRSASPTGAELVTQFTALTELSLDSNNDLTPTRLDSITNLLGHQLIRLEIPVFWGHSTYDLDIASFVALKHLDIGGRDINVDLSQLTNSIEYLDVSNTNIDIAPLHDDLTDQALRFPNLTALGIGSRLETEADTIMENIIKNYGANLTQLDISDNNLTQLNLAGLPLLQALDISLNDRLIVDLNLLPKQINRLDISLISAANDASPLVKLTELSELGIGGFPIRDSIDAIINASRSTLTNLALVGTDIIELDIKDMSNLTELYVYENYFLKSLTTTNLPVLNILNVDGTLGLTSLNIAGLPALSVLGVSYNLTLTSLSVADLPALVALAAYDNDAMTSLSVADLPALETLNVYRNDAMTSLSVAGLPALETLNAYSNDAMTSLSVADLPALVALAAYDNDAMTSLSVANLPALETLNAYYNHAMTSLSVADLPALETLNAYYNHAMTSLSVADLPALETLNAYSNDAMTSLSVADLPALETLNAYSNDAMTSLSVADLPALETLNAYYNGAMTSLSVAGLPALETLSAYYNSELSTLTMDADTTANVDIWGTQLNIAGLEADYPHATFRY
ncbi:hypothetical protein ACRZ5S_04310 [Vibrio scophthalmi]|uniref:leucine-rich repeat domain-containing protein n=1 Tax=Vibrio scophthalmi TaxID=45658 RepID=UPI003EB8F6D5